LAHIPSFDALPRYKVDPPPGTGRNHPVYLTRHNWILASTLFFIRFCRASRYIALAINPRTSGVLQGDLCDSVKYRLSLLIGG
jgi:hypothetical protein